MRLFRDWAQVNTRLRQRYIDRVVPKILSINRSTNAMSVGTISRVVVSMGIKSAHQERKRLDEAIAHLSLIVGQKPCITKAKRAISGFRLREGMEVGCFVTLRGRRMWEFLDRLLSVALPRVRDFRGLRSTAFDGCGNFSMGLSEQVVFPEIDADKVVYAQGMNIAVVTTCVSDEQGRLLLSELGFPFERHLTKDNVL